jgi:hypothetical protein
MARFIISNNDNTFDVIEGRQLNDKPLNRAEADRLARRSPVAAAPPTPPIGAKAPVPPTRKPAAQSAPEPAPLPDLRAEPWLSAGGSAGFSIRGR